MPKRSTTRKLKTKKAKTRLLIVTSTDARNIERGIDWLVERGGDPARYHATLDTVRAQRTPHDFGKIYDALGSVLHAAIENGCNCVADHKGAGHHRDCWVTRNTPDLDRLFGLRALLGAA